MKIAQSCCLAFSVMCVWTLGANAPVRADQHAPELPGLFAELQQSSEHSETTRLESLIWQHWLDAPDGQAHEIMAEITQAMAGSDLAVALQLCNELVKSYPDYAEAWNKRATVHYLLRNNVASVADIRETIALEPRHFGAISGLGFIFLRERNLEAALAAFEQVLDISPGSLNVQRSVEQLRNELGREI